MHFVPRGSLAWMSINVKEASFRRLEWGIVGLFINDSPSRERSNRYPWVYVFINSSSCSATIVHVKYKHGYGWPINSFVQFSYRCTCPFFERTSRALSKSQISTFFRDDSKRDWSYKLIISFFFLLKSPRDLFFSSTSALRQHYFYLIPERNCTFLHFFSPTL